MLRHHCTLLGPIGPVLLALVLALGGGPAAVAGAQPAQPPAAQPGLVLAGTQLPDLTRYSITINNQTESTLSDLQVTVQLPEDAVFDHALETPGFTQFQGPDGQTLTWQGASFAPNDSIDALTFFLAQPSSGTFTIGATWGGNNPGQVQSQVQPSIRMATETEGDITINAATLAQGSAPVGNTGVVVGAVSGQIPDGTTLQVHVLGPDSNPAGVPGDLWWCSIVEVDGLPTGAGVLLEVPARQPLPPAASVQLFGQDGDQWNALPDTAQVSADGQSILYVHHGGVVAAGTSASNQPVLASGLTVSPVFQSSPVVRQIQGNQIILTEQEWALAKVMVQAAHCPPGNCAGLQPCFDSVMIAGIACVNGSVRSEGASVSGVIGQTFCQPGGGPCTGFVGLLPGGSVAPSVLAPPGHGTRCTFVGFTQPTSPLPTCSTF